MVSLYTKSLIDNLNKKHIPKKMNLILEGGGFQGGQLIGILYFIKDLENMKLTSVDKLYTCSISSVIGLCYLTNHLDNAVQLYDDILNGFKTKFNFKRYIKIVRTFCKQYITQDDLKKINHKLYITYFNTHKKKRIVRKKYKTIKDLADCIIRSSFLPILTDGNPTYKNKYMDGGLPVLIHNKNTHTLYIKLLTLRTIPGAITVTHENNVYTRVLHGIIDIDTFFTTNKKSKMCSYVNHWGIIDYTGYYLKYLIILCIVVFIDIIVRLAHYIPASILDTYYYNILKQIVISLFVNISKYLYT